MVEQPSDLIPIERSGEFHGRYHVLGGALSPIDGVDPEDLHISELLGRVDNGAAVREVVIATNATTTGEATALHLADALHERAPEVAVTRLASGLPVGSDLEYADEITLGRALARPPGALMRISGESGVASPPEALERALGTARFVERIERGHVLVGQREVEDLGVLLDSLAVSRLRDDDEIPLHGPA